MLSGGSMQQTKKNQGFTLIELMVTVAIMAIIAMMAVPSFGDILEKRRYEQNARELLLILSQAKSQAILSRGNVNANLASNSANTPTMLNWTVRNSGTTLSISPSVTASTFIFDSNGLVSNISGDTTITLCNSKVKIKKIIVVTRLGAFIIKSEGTC